MCIRTCLAGAAAFVAALCAATSSSADPGVSWEAWTYADTEPANLERPWGGCCAADYGAGPGVGMQKIVHEHANFHCTEPFGCNSTYGAAFIAWHRQWLLDADIYRLSIGCDRVEPWEAGQGAVIPGEDETAATGFQAANCADGVTARPAGATCDGCADMPNSLVGDNLAAFTSLGAVGAELECSAWHGGLHTGASGEGCHDIGTTCRAVRDPAFIMLHAAVDRVARDWQNLQACDIVIVLDRSGSMDDNCPGGDADPGETPCKLNDAKEAALLLADMIADSHPDGSHMVGLVSFAGAATEEMGLTAPAGLVTDDGAANTAFEIALDGIAASGCTSLGAGLQAAVDMLNDDGANQHQAILFLTDGLQTCNDEIADVAGIGDIQICSIGFGEGAASEDLRTVSEEHAGIFIADSDVNPAGITFQKFFVDCFGQIFDEAISQDPVLVLPAGRASSVPICAEVCGDETSLVIVTGREPLSECPLRLVVETPAGNYVNVHTPPVERGTGRTYEFVRIPLPHMGESSGTWKAWLVRDQRVFVNPFFTNAYAVPLEGLNLVRRQIHHLFPRGRIGRVLYHEDSPPNTMSAYRGALLREVNAGTVGMLVEAPTPADFAAALTQQWDLIVLARQYVPSPQVYDTTLAGLICQGQRAIITDFYTPAAAPNPILQCAGASPGGRFNWTSIIGDGRLFDGTIRLTPVPGVNVFSYEVFPAPMPPMPVGLRATNELGSGAILGSASNCDDQTYFYSTLLRGLGRVSPFNARPRILVGQNILATFQLSFSSRPVGGWDSVVASVTVTPPPGVGAPETYPLFDDGTNGDKLAGNSVWSRLIPDVPTVPGAYRLSASFDLTRGGCTRHREAECSVIVIPEPQDCSDLICQGFRLVRAGEVVYAGRTCARNMCLARDSFAVTVRDTAGWLCTRDRNGAIVPIQIAQFETPVLEAGAGACFGTFFPLFVCPPAGASPGEATTVIYEVRSNTRPNQPAKVCSTAFRVDTGEDCNGNGVADTIDIDNGAPDRNGNGIPDGCEQPCPCEFDRVPGVNVFDLLAYLNLWFPGLPGADIDGIPGVDVFDLLFFLECWFPASAGQPCP